MNNLLTKLSLLLFICLLSACDNSPPPKEQILENLGQTIIPSLHRAFVAQSTLLVQKSNQFCQQADARESFEQTQQQWITTMQAWQALKVVQFGPVTVENQAWKIQFWPDKRNLVHRKMNLILNQAAPITLEMIENGSVLIQGLSAMEYVLFDPEAGKFENFQKNPRYCDLLQTVAQHVQGVAQHLSTSWASYSPSFSYPVIREGSDSKAKKAAEQSEFPDVKTALSAIVDSLVSSLEIIKKDKLEGPLGLGLNPQTPNPYLSEAWRSQSSLKQIQANLLGIQRIYYADDLFGIHDYLLDSYSTRDSAETIEQQFQALDQALAQFSTPMVIGLTTEKEHQQLVQLYEQITQLISVFKRALPLGLEVTLGFNANDGD